ncbi:MAG: glycosyltransferase family 39 protein [Phycisphaerales bacterium]
METSRARAAGSRWAGALVALVVLGVALGAAGLLGVSTLQAEKIKGAIDRASPDGSAWTFPTERVSAILGRSRGMGMVFAAWAVLLAALWRPSVRYARDVLDALVPLAWEGWKRTVRLVKRERLTAIVLLAIVAVGLVLRLDFIHQGIRCDEATTYMTFASRALVYGLSDYPAPNNHVFYTLLVHLATKVLGNEPWVIRLPALAFGLLLIPATFAVARPIFGRGAAIIAATLVAVNPYLVQYSVNGRGYSFVALAFVVVLGLVWHAAKTGRRGAVPLIIAAAGLGFWAIPTMLYPFGACMAWWGMVILRERGGSLRGLASRLVDPIVAGMGTILVTFILYTPVIVVSGLSSLTSNRYVKPANWQDFSSALSERFAGMVRDATVSTPMVAVWLMALGLVAGLVASVVRGRGAYRGVPVALTVIGWCVAMLLLQRAAPYGRVWTFAMPLAAAVIGCGLVWLVELSPRAARRVWVPMLVAVALSLPTAVESVRTRSVSQRIETDGFDDARAIVAYAKANIGPQARILSTHPPRPILEYHVRVGGLPDAVVSREPGGLPYSHVLLDVPLEQFNERLRFEGVPELSADRVTVVKQFKSSALWRIDPPMVSEKAAQR